MDEKTMIAILKNPYANRSTVDKIREQVGYMNRYTMSKELSEAYSLTR